MGIDLAVPTTVMNQKKDYSISCFVYALISILIIPVGFLTSGLLTIVSLALSITSVVLSRKTLKINKASGLAKAGLILSIISIVLTVLLGFIIIALALSLANSNA